VQSAYTCRCTAGFYGTGMVPSLVTSLFNLCPSVPS